MSLKFVQSSTLYQAGAGNIIGATSIVLTNLTDVYGNVLTMTDFGAKGYGTMEPDTSNEEPFTFTGLVANANGIYTLTGVSTTLAKSPYTETSGTVRQHSGGTKVVITDNVAFWNTFANTANQNTFADVQTFSVPPVSATNPTTSTQVANKAYVDGVAIAGGTNASDSVKGITKLSVAPASGTNPIAVGDNDTRLPTQNENDALVGTSGTATSGSNKLVDNADTTGTGSVVRQSVTNGIVNGIVKFGGTGADGALSIASGTTTIDCANAAYVEKNYTSISITGTGKLAFVNPNANGTIVVLRSQGDVTLTSSTAPMIDMSGMGAPGGNGGVYTGGAGSSGNTGTAGNGYFLVSNAGGGGSTSVGTGGAAITTIIYTTFSQILNRYFGIFVGAGGGGGSGGYNSTGGNGGRGGGALVIECAGAWNFTTASGISVAGTVGTNGSGGSVAGGGGAGGGGFFLALYNTLTANSGTVTVSGGSTSTGTGGYGGGGGGSYQVGSTSSNSIGVAGGSGLSQIVKNVTLV